MHDYVYLAQRRSKEFSCEPISGGVPPPPLGCASALNSLREGRTLPLPLRRLKFFSLCGARGLPRRQTGSTFQPIRNRKQSTGDRDVIRDVVMGTRKIWGGRDNDVDDGFCNSDPRSQSRFHTLAVHTAARTSIVFTFIRHERNKAK